MRYLCNLIKHQSHHVSKPYINTEQSDKRLCIQHHVALAMVWNYSSHNLGALGDGNRRVMLLQSQIVSCWLQHEHPFLSLWQIGTIKTYVAMDVQTTVTGLL